MVVVDRFGRVRRRGPDDVPAGRRHRRQRHAREGEAKQGEKGEDDKLAPIRQPFEPGNPGRRRLRQPGETAEQLGAQLAMNLLGRDAAIGIGVDRAGLRQRSPGRQEELAFGKDAIPIEAAIALMEDAGAQRPLFEVRCERIARKGLGDRVVGQAVAIRGTLAAAQHRPKLDAEGCFHLGPEGARRPVEIRLDHEDGIVARTLEYRHRHEMERGHALLQCAVRFRRPRWFLVLLEFLDETRKAPGALRLHVQDNGQDRLPHFTPPD